LGIPNFSGLNGLIQSILDRDILDKHNLDIMNLNFFNEIEKRVGLEKIFVDYIGSFEPALAIPKYRIGNLIQFFVRCILFGVRILRQVKFFDRFNSKFFSSYILAVYRKV
jgi:hypothetical protein